MNSVDKFEQYLSISLMKAAAGADVHLTPKEVKLVEGANKILSTEMCVIKATRVRRMWPLAMFCALSLLVSGVDAIAFEQDFHYYAVYYILRAKGYPTAAANDLAGFSQYVDDNFYTEPIFCRASTRARFHFADSGPNTATVRNCQEARTSLSNAFSIYLAGEPEGKYVAGAALHLMADTFSHQTFTAWWNRTINYRTGSLRPCIGHADAAEGGKAPDRPYNDPMSALGAALAIYKIVPTYPGGTSLPLPTLLAKLDPVFALPANGNEDRTSINVRVKFMKELIYQQFGETVNYDKKQFAKEKDAFVAAVR
jgi:hypothetical protein